MSLLKTKSQHFSAFFMASFVTGMILPDAVFAGAGGGAGGGGNTLDDYLKKTSGNVNSIPDAVAFICYLGGAALAGLGIVNLKQHVENPGNVPMKNGLAKLGFGGMLLALPSITAVMMDTTGSNAANAQRTTFSKPSF